MMRPGYHQVIQFRRYRGAVLIRLITFPSTAGDRLRKCERIGSSSSFKCYN